MPNYREPPRSVLRETKVMSLEIGRVPILTPAMVQELLE